MEPSQASYFEVDRIWTDELAILEHLGKGLLTAHSEQLPSVSTSSPDSNGDANITIRPAVAHDSAIRDNDVHTVHIEP